MGRYAATVGAVARAQDTGADARFLELGMLAATARADAADLVAAHKWFNLAAMHGNERAARLRLEIAAEMSAAEIAAARGRMTKPEVAVRLPFLPSFAFPVSRPPFFCHLSSVVCHPSSS